MDSYLPDAARLAASPAVDADPRDATPCSLRPGSEVPRAMAHIQFDMFGTIHIHNSATPSPASAPSEPVDFGPAWRAITERLAGGIRRLGFGAGAVLVIAGGMLLQGAPAKAQTLLNVSYDPTRELYREFDKAFAAHWEAEGHSGLEIKTSHGGSGAQARAVIDGLGAQVVTLALASDVDAIATKSGKIPADWQSKLPHNSAPYTSTIVFLVREGNPKGIENWDDLVTPGVQVITPNPKTSGGARWNYLAAWAFASKEFGGDEAKIRDFVGKLFANVPVLDTGARGSTTTFAQRGIGDVLLAWENEAFLALKELGDDKFDIVIPSISILAEPTVALVPGNITSDEQGAAAQAYLDYLYAPEGQAIALRNFYRAWDTSKADPADVARFPKLDLVSIADFGGWAKVQPEHFGDGGIFDQIYTPK